MSIYLKNLIVIWVLVYLPSDASCRRGQEQALFNIYGEYINRETIEKWEKYFPIRGKRLSNLRYADDTVFLATFMQDMKELF